MTDLKTQAAAAVQTAKTTVDAEAKILRRSVLTFVLAHIPTVVAGVGGYAAGAFGLVGKLLKYFL